ncbi:phosphatase PAP2 family protein [Streptococcus hyovaginalis]|uniref:phosphatase PAP2 family protein n=1 Tax=Streptococcus hyovaginalis TaxID=149015 RepID=UPI002A801786|nr:phosphatase PAP2 family protein [Streptococcus hyovaginalis]MDY4511648.1 phosphatase PAP2 family protein [Streptococcus hyovaginalis]
MKNYEIFYRGIERFFAQHPNFKRLMIAYNWFITKIMYVLYPCLLVYLYLGQSEDLGKSIVIPGIAFSLVSIFRKWRNQPRPYERWHIRPLMTRHGVGESFPSRHVFSATMISMCFLVQSIWLGLLLLVLSAGLALCRVLGGVHYPKDVLVGFALGILFGILLFFNLAS